MRKAVLFLVGFCTYITIEVCYRGYSSPLMGLTAGIIMLFLDSINEKISWDFDLLAQGIIGSAMVTLSELGIGEMLICIYGVNTIWDYSKIPFNFDGVICPQFSIVWILISIIGIIVADAINYYVFEELPVPYYKMFGKVIIKFPKKKCKLSRF